jgi:hypothetical protein
VVTVSKFNRTIVGRGKIYNPNTDQIKIKSFSFYNYFVFYKLLYTFFLSGVNEKIGKVTDNVCSHGDADDLTILILTVLHNYNLIKIFT